MQATLIPKDINQLLAEADELINRIFFIGDTDREAGGTG